MVDGDESLQVVFITLIKEDSSLDIQKNEILSRIFFMKTTRDIEMWFILLWTSILIRHKYIFVLVMDQC